MLRSSWNCSVMRVLPWPLEDVMESTPAIRENCFSRGVATEEARIHVDGGKIDVRQFADGEIGITKQTRENKSRHQQGRHDGASDEDRRKMHIFLRPRLRDYRVQRGFLPFSRCCTSTKVAEFLGFGHN